MTIINIVGARPNFMKIAPIMEAYKSHPHIHPLLVHTGQHYDEKMSGLFFRELGIPQPDINLGVGSGSQTFQVAEIMKSFEPILLQHKPKAVLVVGDVNSTIACGLVAVKLGVKLVHVEAGLRSFDRTMPEEINRVLTDSISDLLLCSEQSGIDNLAKEGVPTHKTHLVGNVMIDTLLKHLKTAQQSNILDTLGIQGQFAVLTLHRPSNVDDMAVMSRILDALEVIQKDMPIVFPVHPRTRKNLATGSLGPRASNMTHLMMVDPLGYLDFMKLLSTAKIVLTDSGGIQEETTILKVPCLTIRDNTERPVTVTTGSNQLVGTDVDKILNAYKAVMQGKGPVCGTPPLWDGQAATRIVQILTQTL